MLLPPSTTGTTCATSPSATIAATAATAPLALFVHHRRQQISVSLALYVLLQLRRASELLPAQLAEAHFALFLHCFDVQWLLPVRCQRFHAVALKLAHSAVERNALC